MIQIADELLQTLKDLHHIQGSEGNFDYSPYMLGMYNGMELFLSIIENREAVFKSPPISFSKDILSEKVAEMRDRVETEPSFSSNPKPVGEEGTPVMLFPVEDPEPEEFIAVDNFPEKT